jgi:hypothetical protein
MGLNSDNSISEDYEIEGLFGQPAFLLNAVGYTMHATFKLHAQMHSDATSYKLPLLLEHDLVEDG